MWMYKLFPQILNMSVTASIVIVLVLVARLLLKRAPKVFSYALWAVVLFRLICPVSFSAEFSLIGLIRSSTATINDGTYSNITYIPTDIVHIETPQVDLPVLGVSQAINNSLPQGEEQLAADPLEFPIAVATLLWIFGIGGMLIYSAVSLLRLRRKLVGAVRLRDNIYLADHIVTPFVVGVFRPKIYLPSTLREEELSYVILHEQTHIRRLDHIVKMLAFLALAVHWFNPLVWAAFVFAVKDMEMSCDERVLKQMGGDIKGAYGASLLSLATGRRLINGSPLAFGEGSIKGRIKNVLNFKKPAAWVVVISVLMVAALSIGFAANGVVSTSDPDGYKTAFIELPTFISEDTDLVKLGKFAFTTYMDYLSSEGMPVEERIASYKLNEISVLAGDINEFCVALNYDITTDSDNYLNPALGAQGKGTWPDNYMEIRVVKHADDNVYSIKSVGTGGGAQGLVPYSMAFDYGGLHLQVTYVSNVRTEKAMDGDGVENHEYTVFICYPGAVIKVLDADMSDPVYSEDGKAHPEWAVATTASELSGKRIYITDGMEPYIITPDTLGIYDPESSEFVLRFEMANAVEASPVGAGELITQVDVNQDGQENYNLGKLEKDYILVAFVDDMLSETEARALQSVIEQNPNVDYADFVTREEAMKSFEDNFEDKSLFENIDSRMFRHRYSVCLRDISLTEQTAKDIMQIEGIARVNAVTLPDVAFLISPSDKFSESEISSAIDFVIVKFNDFKGCQLTKLWYDEEKSNNQIDNYMDSGRGSFNGISKDNVIVLYSDFTVDSSGGDGSLNPNSTYSNWCWILIRDSEEGEWRVDDWGY